MDGFRRDAPLAFDGALDRRVDDGWPRIAIRGAVFLSVGVGNCVRKGYRSGLVHGGRLVNIFRGPALVASFGPDVTDGPAGSFLLGQPVGHGRAVFGVGQASGFPL